MQPRFERQLRDRGFVAAGGSACADVVIVNTCTVTAAADAQARDAIRKLHARNPAARVDCHRLLCAARPRRVGVVARCFVGCRAIHTSRKFLG